MTGLCLCTSGGGIGLSCYRHLLGVPMVPGWDHPGSPCSAGWVSGATSSPAPEAIQALSSLSLALHNYASRAVIILAPFFDLGITVGRMRLVRVMSAQHHRMKRTNPPQHGQSLPTAQRSAPRNNRPP